jgi:hypothetical protein
MCNGVHVHHLGVCNCPETRALISEGLIMFSPQGRLVCMDGTDLPRNTIGSGGVARSLQEEQARQNEPGPSRKGKECETPPHFTQHAGIQCDGHDLLDRDVYAISSTSTWPISYLATQSQKESLFEPYPSKKPERKQKLAPIIPPPTKQTPELQKPVPPPLPTVPSVQQASKPVKTTPNMLSQPTLAPQPPYRNTADAWKDQRKAKPVAKKLDHQDVKMQDASKNKGGYHFTSTVQEMADGDTIQAHILDTIIMLPLQEILGISADLQKRFASLTKTQQEYSPKTATASHSYIEDHDYSSGGESDYEMEADSQLQENNMTEGSRLQLSYNAQEDVHEILECYMSAVSLQAALLFAMATRHFEGSMAGHNVVFMVDTGSELNLMSEGFHR